MKYNFNRKSNATHLPPVTNATYNTSTPPIQIIHLFTETGTSPSEVRNPVSPVTYESSPSIQQYKNNSLMLRILNIKYTKFK